MCAYFKMVINFENKTGVLPSIHHITRVTCVTTDHVVSEKTVMRLMRDIDPTGV